MPVLEVSPSGYYASCRRAPSWHALIDEVLLARVRSIHAENGETYGAPRVHRELQAEGSRARSGAKSGQAQFRCPKKGSRLLLGPARQFHAR